ncbi:hypothetical protein ASE75_07800 [Sphingomonas sp. Leaf17]|uniref:hypothetical protein n=1 Tax=Sphingomonas sp. Leaf17 TaxID=1735683 RepID=UPI000701825A|nr:hypothetical protein [Sphingomonas sp. Leaf17]KQM64959.1 hypothetical protein ASE75_07800 [Sphingomonas sp. Leaf17]
MRALISTMAAVRSRKRIVRDFVHAGAVTPRHAIAYEPRGDMRRLFRQLRQFGAIVEPAPGRFYLDSNRLTAFRHVARRRRFGWLATIGAAAATATATMVALAE